jgi:SH3-like domain-containing protein
LPIPANSESIGVMKIHGAHCRRVAAAVSVLTMLSLDAAAQEGGQLNEEQPQEQQAPRQLFVSDKLVLNVYAEPDQGSARVATISTGEAVEELERSQNFIRVRLESSREGWVGASYLTSEAPAAVRVRELQREQKTAIQAAEKKSADEIARLKKESAALLAQVTALKTAATSTANTPFANPVQVPPEEAPDTQQEEGVAEELAAVAPAQAGGAMWMWLPIVVLATTGLGFAAGYQTLARRLRKKFGGLKIY